MPSRTSSDFGPRRHVRVKWTLDDRTLLIQKIAEGFSLDEIRSRWFPSRTIKALKIAGKPDVLKRQEARTLSADAKALLVKLIQDDKPPHEMKQALSNVPHLAWHIKRLRGHRRVDRTSLEKSRHSYAYSGDEWQHILELHAQGLSSAQLSAVVNRSPRGIAAKLAASNVVANKSIVNSKPWTQAECAVLQPHIHRRVINFAEIAIALPDRTTASVVSKLSRLRAKHDVALALKGNSWNEADLKLIRSEVDEYLPYSATRSITAIAKRLGRTPSAIYNKIRRMSEAKVES